MGYKLKRITIRPNGTEKQIRPKNTTQVFTYDFKSAWSVAQMQTDWWVFSNTNGWDFASNWLHQSGSGNKNFHINNVLDCSSFTKITIVENFYVNWNSWWGTQWASIIDSSNNGAWAYFTFRANTASNYNGYGMSFQSTWFLVNTVALRAWNYTGTLIIDAVNLTATLSVTWKTDLTAPLVQTDIDLIKTGVGMWIDFDNSWNYIQDITVTIE